MSDVYNKFRFSEEDLKEGSKFICLQNEGLSGCSFTIGKEYEIVGYDGELIEFETDGVMLAFCNIESFLKCNQFVGQSLKGYPYCVFVPSSKIDMEDIFMFRLNGVIHES